MMMLESNKQKMYYSLQTEEIPVYETDDDGNIIYIDVDGESIPVSTGDTELGYSEPVEMFANISFGTTETTTQEFGVDVSDYDAIVVYGKGKYPLTETALIWFESEPRYKDYSETIIDGDSADYKVVSVRNTLNEGKAILKHLAK